jgi:hypothetical protein
MSSPMITPGIDSYEMNITVESDPNNLSNGIYLTGEKYLKVFISPRTTLLEVKTLLITKFLERAEEKAIMTETGGGHTSFTKIPCEYVSPTVLKMNIELMGCVTTAILVTMEVNSISFQGGVLSDDYAQLRDASGYEVKIETKIDQQSPKCGENLIVKIVPFLIFGAVGAVLIFTGLLW